MFTLPANFAAARLAALAAVLALGLAGIPAVGRAANITIKPGEALQIRFTTLPSPDCGGACDTLIFVLGFTANTADITTARLFDSSKLLGTYKTDPACLVSGTCPGLVPAFVTATSLYQDSAPVIDFTSILNGTIHGVLDISFDNSITFDRTSSFNFFGVQHGTGPSSAAGGYFRAFDSVSLVPEPNPFPVLLPGALVLAGLVAAARNSLASPVGRQRRG